jgi:rhodanese-related sulfurtransferase
VFTLKRRLNELPRDRNIVLYCHSGAAAAKAKETLDAMGFKAFNGGGYKDILKIVGK